MWYRFLQGAEYTILNINQHRLFHTQRIEYRIKPVRLAKFPAGFFMAELILHKDKEYSDQELFDGLQTIHKEYILARKKDDHKKPIHKKLSGKKKTPKEPHGGLEIDINFMTGKSIEFKRSFALMLLIKKAYRNSMVYNYSAKNLSEKMNLSVYVTDKYINSLLKNGYCQFHGPHLQFISLNKIMSRRDKGIVLQIPEKSTINSIVENIEILIIKNNLKKQDKLRTVKNDLTIGRKKDAKINLKSYKKSVKFAESHPEIKDEKIVDLNVLGMRKIANLLGSSIGYATAFIKKLVDKKLILVKRIIKKYANFGFNHFSSDELKSFINKRGGYFYSYKNNLFHYLGTEIVFLPI